MRTIQRWGFVLATVAALVACGGGGDDKPSFKAVVSFGDSLSDVGSYAPATSLAGNGSAPYFGGKFTTNGSTGTVWVENVAAALGVAITPHIVGFGASSGVCPAQLQGAAAAATCTGHAQGGARVTDPNGIGKASGALTIPMKTQIANHLARFTAFNEHDLVLVYGGNNDAFVQLEIFSVTAETLTAQFAASQITQEVFNAQLQSAQVAGLTAMATAAQELAGYVKTDILAKGGRHVAVMNLPDSSATPFGQTLPSTGQGYLAALVDQFNTTLSQGLSGSGAVLVDAKAMVKAAYDNAATYGFTNKTGRACDAAKIQVVTSGQVTDGSSLFCNSTAGAPYNGMTDGASTTTWMFADGVHPTTGGHKVFGNQVLDKLRAIGWL